MSNSKPNYNIHCSVQTCAHHCGKEDYCALESVRIGTHEAEPTQVECTDCQSFLKK